MFNIAIFASGKGTNAENIIKYFKESDQIKVQLVVCNNSSAGVVEKASRLGVTTEIVGKTLFAHKNYITALLRRYSIDIIVLAGFMLLVPDFLVEEYKIINIHPSLLPMYGGKGMYGNHVHSAVKDNGDKESGITIHYVNREYDKGAIIAQFKTELSPDDSVVDIANKVHKLEYEHYPTVIEQILLQNYDI